MITEPHFGIVIKPDGRVPFDADLDPAHRRAMIGHLIEGGHTISHHVDPATGARHVMLLTGPFSPGEIEATRDRQAAEFVKMHEAGEELDPDVLAAARARLAAKPAAGRAKPKT